ncbi:membrane protein [Microbacterium phage Rasputia]|nr:membrane protein [Microbacterium phage Rasputia]
MVINKYLAGLLTVLVVALTAFQAALSDGFTLTEGWQIAGLVVAAFVTVFVKLVDSNWAAMLKVSGSVLGAAIAAIVPFLTGGWDASAVTIVVLAVLNTLVTQLGVDIRLDSIKSVLEDPQKSNQLAFAVDPAAAAIVSPPTPMEPATN